ncbi:MAG: carbohydrate kinase family protein, partial [Pyrinomonadaceae bacterium]
SVPEYPAFGSKIEFGNYARFAGGEVATTVAGLQRLGLKTYYAGKFGRDDAGKFGIDTLSEEGIDLQYCATVEDAETQIAFIIIDESSGERTVTWKRDKRLSFAADEAPIEAVNSCRLLHMTHHDTAACIRLAAAARTLGVPVSLDIDNVVEGIDELFPLVDIMIAGSEFPEKFLGISDPRAALAEMSARFGNALIGITLGNRGSLLLCGGEYIETSGFDVPGGCRDTTGAGDAFRTGLLYGLLTGETIETAAVMANAVAALKCREIGARTALPTRSELDAFLKNT